MKIFQKMARKKARSICGTEGKVGCFCMSKICWIDLLFMPPCKMCRLSINCQNSRWPPNGVLVTGPAYAKPLTLHYQNTENVFRYLYLSEVQIQSLHQKLCWLWLWCTFKFMYYHRIYIAKVWMEIPFCFTFKTIQFMCFGSSIVRTMIVYYYF